MTRSGAGRGAPAPARREPRAIEARPVPEAEPANGDAVTQSMVVRAEQAEPQSEQCFGSVTRRAAILAAVVCVY